MMRSILLARKLQLVPIAFFILGSCTNPVMTEKREALHPFELIDETDKNLDVENLLPRTYYSAAEASAMITKYGLKTPYTTTDPSRIRDEYVLNRQKLPEPMYNNIAGEPIQGIIRNLTTNPIRNSGIFDDYIKILNPTAASFEAEAYFRLKLVTTLKVIDIYLSDSNGSSAGYYRIVNPGYLDLYIPVYGSKGKDDETINVKILSYYPEKSISPSYDIKYDPLQTVCTFSIRKKRNPELEFLYPTGPIDSQSRAVVDKAKEVIGETQTDEEKMNRIYHWIQATYHESDTNDTGFPRASELILGNQRNLVCRNYSTLMAAMCRPWA